MSLAGRLRRVRRRVGRALRPSRLLASFVLLVTMGVAVWLLLLVVAQNTVKGDQPAARAATPTTVAPHPVTHSPATTHRPTTTPTTAGRTSTQPTVPLGVYAGPGAPGAATAFSADAGAPVPYAFDYLDGRQWGGIADPMWPIQQWDGSGFRMVWGVPMLPNQGATLAAGAAGDYDAEFTELAGTLVDHGQGNSIIMLGWDPQSASVPWAVSNAEQAAEYVSYWRQIVSAMRAVDGQQFLFAWDMAPGPGPVPVSALYPGNSYVDIVATDAFDQGTTVVALGWNGFAASPEGPDYYASFALHRDKLFMIAKWGVVPSDDQGGGDSAAFVSSFLRWADAEHLFVAITWDYGTWALTGGGFPQAAATLHRVAAASVVPPISRAVDA